MKLGFREHPMLSLHRHFLTVPPARSSEDGDAAASMRRAGCPVGAAPRAPALGAAPPPHGWASPAPAATSSASTTAAARRGLMAAQTACGDGLRKAALRSAQTSRGAAHARLRRPGALGISLFLRLQGRRCSVCSCIRLGQIPFLATRGGRRAKKNVFDTYLGVCDTYRVLTAAGAVAFGRRFGRRKRRRSGGRLRSRGSAGTRPRVSAAGLPRHAWLERLESGGLEGTCGHASVWGKCVCAEPIAQRAKWFWQRVDVCLVVPYAKA
jgi:hypothetical protein